MCVCVCVCVHLTNNILISTRLFNSHFASLFQNVISHIIPIAILKVYNFKFTIEIPDWNPLLNSNTCK